MRRSHGRATRWRPSASPRSGPIWTSASSGAGDIPVRRGGGAYVNAEPFYDPRYDAVIRWRYETGIEILMNEHWRLEPHYLRQEDSRAEPRHTNAFGLILKYYR